METIDILGIPHTYELTAPIPSAPVLVFIHGWLLSRRYWLPLIQELSSDYQCLTYDLRGFGDSALLPDTHHRTFQVQPAIGSPALPDLPPPPEDRPTPSTPATASALQYTPATYARDLIILLQRLRIKQAWLIGHSLGGSIALWAADQLRGSVHGVVCLNSGGGIYLKEEFERFRTLGRRIVQFRPPWLAYLPLVDRWFCHANVVRPLDRCWGKQRIIDFLSAHPEAALGALLDSTTPDEVHQLPQIVSRIQQPVYFIAGREDPVMELKYVHHLASFHSLFKSGQCNVIEVAHCGHLGMIEQTQEVATHLKAILQQNFVDGAV